MSNRKPKDKTRRPLLTFKCAYAYEVSCYVDFQVTAVSRLSAQRKINAALRAGHFNDAEAKPYWDDTTGHRAFVTDPLKPHQGHYPSLESIVASSSPTL